MELVLEITRKCNMACSHCLRGKAEQICMNENVIDEVIKKLPNFTWKITFSGGEPTINFSMIDYTMRKLKELNKEFGSFFIATNGLNNNNRKFIEIVKNAHDQATLKENCIIKVSNDQYHMYQRSEKQDADLGLLKLLPFRVINENDKDSIIELVNQGFYKDNFNDGHSPEIHDRNDLIYVNVKGELFNNCNLSYEEQSIRNKQNNKTIFDKTIHNLETIFMR